MPYLHLNRGSKLVSVKLVLASLLISASAFAAPSELKYKVVRNFSTLFEKVGTNPLGWLVNSPDGIAWDGSGLWVSECTGTTFAKLDPKDGKLLDRFVLPTKDSTEHLVWDGAFLWGVIHLKQGPGGPHDHQEDGRLIKIDPKTRDIVKTINLPFRDAATMSPMGLAWDGKFFYSMDLKNLDIYRINPETGEGTDKPFTKTPIYNGTRIDNPCGIAYDGYGCFWIADLTLGKFLVTDLKTGEVAYTLNPPDNPEPAKYGKFRPPEVKKLFTGSTTDGKRVWAVDELEGNPLAWELDVEFPTTGLCAHPVALGKACVPGGQPFCDTASVCYDDGSTKTCQPKCGAGAAACPAGTTCQDKNGVSVCLTPPPPDQNPENPENPEQPADQPSSGSGCATMPSATNAIPSALLLLSLLTIALIARRRRE